MRLLVPVLMLAAGCSEAGPDEPQPKPRQAEAIAAVARDACASPATYGQLKSLAFREALRVRRAKSPLLQRVYSHSVVRMEEPLLRRRDDAMGVTVCTGRFIIELPPAHVDAFDGDRRLMADIEYAAQPAADGSGLVYQMSGAEPIIYRLAAVALHEPPPPMVITRAPAPPSIATPRAPGAPVPNRCAGARSQDERMICADRGLTRRAQRVEEAYARAMGNGSARIRRALEASSRRFAAYRSRCPNRACLEEALEDRLEEIRDIARD